MEEETVGVSERFNQAMRQQFPRNCHAYMHSFEFPEAWAATSRLDHPLSARHGYFIDWYQ